MANKSRTKVNKLISNWPRGAVYTAAYLKQSGYHYDLIRFYKIQKWIESVGNGAYKLYGDRVEWFGGLYALQNQMGLDVHVGGKTALTLQGHGHYLSEKIPRVFLYGRRGDRLPHWFKQFPWSTEIRYATTNLFTEAMPRTFSTYPYRDFSVRISAPERAAMEMLYFVPKEQGFDEAQKIIENLFTLRPQLVQKLLENCNSIKTKRLFLYLAEKQSLPWVRKLDLSRINLGSGARQIVAGGFLDKKFKITVPKETQI